MSAINELQISLCVPLETLHTLAAYCMAAAGYLKYIEIIMSHYITSVNAQYSQMHSVPAVGTCLCLWKGMLAVGLQALYRAIED